MNVGNVPFSRFGSRLNSQRLRCTSASMFDPQEWSDTIALRCTTLYSKGIRSAPDSTSAFLPNIQFLCSSTKKCAIYLLSIKHPPFVIRVIYSAHHISIKHPFLHTTYYICM